MSESYYWMDASRFVFKPRSEVCRAEATGNPIFLLQKKIGRHWETECVFYSREEGEAFGNEHAYNYKNGWRVYSVPCGGVLATLLKVFDPNQEVVV
jgi:hypothetical protein